MGKNSSFLFYLVALLVTMCMFFFFGKRKNGDEQKSQVNSVAVTALTHTMFE